METGSKEKENQQVTEGKDPGEDPVASSGQQRDLDRGTKSKLWPGMNVPRQLREFAQLPVG